MAEIPFGVLDHMGDTTETDADGRWPVETEDGYPLAYETVWEGALVCGYCATEKQRQGMGNRLVRSIPIVDGDGTEACAECDRAFREIMVMVRTDGRMD